MTITTPAQRAAIQRDQQQRQQIEQAEARYRQLVMKCAADEASDAEIDELAKLCVEHFPDRDLLKDERAQRAEIKKQREHEARLAEIQDLPAQDDLRRQIADVDRREREAKAAFDAERRELQDQLDRRIEVEGGKTSMSNRELRELDGIIDP